MLLQIMCISFLFFTFIWDENHTAILQYLSQFMNKFFKVKIFDRVETYDSDSGGEDDDSGDEDEDEAEAEAEAEDEEAEDEAAANTNLRQRIVECGDDTAALEKATREIQQSLQKSL